jgi:hypothetical protein
VFREFMNVTTVYCISCCSLQDGTSSLDMYLPPPREWLGRASHNQVPSADLLGVSISTV